MESKSIFGFVQHVITKSKPTSTINGFRCASFGEIAIVSSHFHTSNFIKIQASETSSLKSFRRRHKEHVEQGRSSRYYEKKLHMKEIKEERKKNFLKKRKQSILNEADSLLGNLEKKKLPEKILQKKKLKREKIENVIKSEKIARYEEMMKRRSRENFMIRAPNSNDEYLMPAEMREEFYREFYESSNKKWISSADREAKFVETMKLLGSRKLTAFNAIKVFDRKIKKYSLHLRTQDYITLLTPLVRNGFVEKSFEIYSRMKYFEKMQIDESIVRMILRSISEATSENERIISITKDDLLVLRQKSNQKDENDEIEKNGNSEDVFHNDPDIQVPKKALKSEGINHLKCIAKAHDLLNKDCLKYSIPIKTPIVTEFIRVLGMHGHPKKANTLFKMMLKNITLNNIAQQSHERDSSYVLNHQSVEALTNLVEELGDEADEELVSALKSSPSSIGQKKKMAMIEGDPELIPNKYTYGIMIEILGYNNDIVSALNIFDNIPRPFKKIPAFNAIFGALFRCKEGFHSQLMLTKEKSPDFAKTVIQYYQELIKLKLNPTKHTFSLILQCIPERSNDIFKEMRVQNVEPDLLLLGQLMNEMVEHGHYVDAINEVLPMIPIGEIPKGVMYKLFQQMIANENLESIDTIIPYLKFMEDSGMKDLKLDPKLKEFFVLKRKFKLLRGLEEEIEKRFTEKYKPAHRREANNGTNNSTFNEAKMSTDDFDFGNDFNSSEETKERNEHKKKRNILRMNSSKAFGALNLKKYEEQV